MSIEAMQEIVKRHEAEHKAAFKETLLEMEDAMGVLMSDEHVTIHFNHFMKAKRSFPEDWANDDNENCYECRCVACGSIFNGYKRRHTCALCVQDIQNGNKPKFTDAKQVILVRKDLNMPAGKLGAQVAHASLACILNMGRMTATTEGAEFRLPLTVDNPHANSIFHWMTTSFPKITLEVKNEAQLKRFHDEAKAAGLPVSWIVDAGRTVFDGVPTPTCVGIGPASREAIDAITKKLRVYQ